MPPIYSVMGDIDVATQHPAITLVNPDGTAYNPALSIPNGTYVDVTTLDQELPAGKDLTVRGLIKWRADDVGGSITAKPLGDGVPGVIDLVNDDITGYLFHLHTGANSLSPAAAIGIGCDNGSGIGIVVSNKAQGNGLSIANNGTVSGASGGGIGIYGSQKAATVFASLVQSNTYTDATITGTTTIALPTAGLAAGDVGIAITGTGIPGPTTLTAVNVGAGTATLSQACTNGTNVTIILFRTTARGALLSLSADASAVAGQQLLALSNNSGSIGIVSSDTGLLRWYKNVQIDGSVNCPAGPLTVGAAALAGSPVLNIMSAAGQNRDIEFFSGGASRWFLRCNNATESGSNVGSDFQFQSRTDGGGAITNVLTLTRSNSTATFAGLVLTAASTATTAGLRLPPGVAPTSPANGDVWTDASGMYVRIAGVTKTVTLT